jgi:MauM/NapG family ferredoxin protein
MTFQRIGQTLSLAAFIFLVGLTAFPLISPVTVEAFITLDPVIVLGTWISSRRFLPAFWTGALVLALTALFGRFFCGTVCPMGTTIDVADRCFGAASRKIKNKDRWRSIKYGLLFFILGAALLGVSFVFLAAPLSLITRFYGLIFHSAFCAVAAKGLSVIRPLAEALNMPALAYYPVVAPRYALQWVTILLFIGIFGGAWGSPRFWCRYLCPAGAAFALLSRNPLIKRNVSDACTRCGICQKKCPMEAIGEDPRVTRHHECIVCETCTHICPTGAIAFEITSNRRRHTISGFSTARRHWLLATLSGAGAAVATQSSLAFPLATTGTGAVAPPNLIRPPGAVPEIVFLAACIRCGACMKACPTNTLQPIGLEAGLAAFFSPSAIVRRGPCEPGCNACGQVCPTSAIRALSEEEKIWAKIGTAQILRHRCLAWEFDRKCLVCDEVCPYDAITLRKMEGIKAEVPFVDETRCSGCGFCEFHCPVQNQSAIEVSPMAALRIATGSYRETGIQQGFSLKLKATRRKTTDPDPAPETQMNELPPGFTP